MGHYGSCVHSNPDKQVFVQCPEQRTFSPSGVHDGLLLRGKLS